MWNIPENPPRDVHLTSGLSLTLDDGVLRKVSMPQAEVRGSVPLTRPRAQSESFLLNSEIRMLSGH